MRFIAATVYNVRALRTHRTHVPSSKFTILFGCTYGSSSATRPPALRRLCQLIRRKTKRRKSLKNFTIPRETYYKSRCFSAQPVSFFFFFFLILLLITQLRDAWCSTHDSGYGDSDQNPGDKSAQEHQKLRLPDRFAAHSKRANSFPFFFSFFFYRRLFYEKKKMKRTKLWHGERNRRGF